MTTYDVWRRLDLIRRRPIRTLSVIVDPVRVPKYFDVRPGEHVWPLLVAYRWCAEEGQPCDIGRHSRDLLTAGGAGACLYCGRPWDPNATTLAGCPGGVRE